MPSPLANRFTHYEIEANLDDWVGWAHAVKQIGHQSRQSQCYCRSRGNPDKRQPRASAYYQPQHAASVGAQGQAQTDFSCPLSHGV